MMGRKFKKNVWHEKVWEIYTIEEIFNSNGMLMARCTINVKKEEITVGSGCTVLTVDALLNNPQYIEILKRQ